MGEMLSQAEIEALLNGEALPDPAAAQAADAGNGEPAGGSPATVAQTGPAESMAGDMDAMLNAMGNAADGDEFIIGDDPHSDFTSEEIDALGEIGNISMGNSATTLFTLLNRKVNITTPTVTVSTLRQIAESYTAPLVVVRVEYTEGLLGSNMLVLRESDVMVITDLMMGGDGTNIQGEITDLHLSAISEAMNQMIGNASTSMSNVFDMKIDISPPNAMSVKINDGNMLMQVVNFDPEEKVAVVSFNMTVENLLDTKIMQIQPLSFAKSMIGRLMDANMQKEAVSAVAAPMQPAASESGARQGEPQPYQQEQQYGQQPYQQAPPYPQAPPPYQQPYPQAPQYAQAPPPPYGPPQYSQAPPQYGPPQYGPPQYGPPNQYVNVQPANFQSFEEEPLVIDKKNIGLVMDVNLEVSVELGRTHKLIREILEFGQGSIIELDKLAGEPVDILVNGKIIAKGEVVVIDESFGVRVTDIIHPSKRI